MPYIIRSSSIHPIKDNSTDIRPFFTACEPDYKNIITNPTLRRRMSRIVKMSVACGLECLGEITPESIGAIITATGLGCLTDTEKFMNTLLDNEEQMLNPTPFIQSTFNTIGAQIALHRQIHAYNMTYVHRGLSFESALLDAMLQVEESNGNVLVGAFDELTPASYAIQQRLGLYKNTYAGEGAQFFLLSSQPATNSIAPIEIKDVGTSLQPYHPEKIRLFLQHNQLSTKDIDFFVIGKNGNSKQDALYMELENNLFATAQCRTFKEQCGEYPTASAFALWKTVQILSKTAQTSNYTSVRTALIYNHYSHSSYSLILIRQYP